MKNLLIAAGLFIVLACASGEASDTKVYICNNKKTEVYHLTEECRAMKRCTYEIKEVTKEEATGKLGLRLCGYED